MSPSTEFPSYDGSHWVTRKWVSDACNHYDDVGDSDRKVVDYLVYIDRNSESVGATGE